MSRRLRCRPQHRGRASGFEDAEGKELANIPIRVRGNLAWSSYQGGNTQRRQINAFEQRLMEEIARLQ